MKLNICSSHKHCLLLLIIFAWLSCLTFSIHKSCSTKKSCKDVRIVVVGAKELSSAAQLYKKIMETRSANESQIKKAMQEIEEELKKEETTLTAKKGLLSKHEFEKEVIKVQQWVGNLNMAMSEIQSKAEGNYYKAMELANQKTNNVIGDVAREKYKKVVVFMAESLAYTSGAPDITQKVVSSINNSNISVPYDAIKIDVQSMISDAKTKANLDNKSSK